MIQMGREDALSFSTKHILYCIWHLLTGRDWKEKKKRIAKKN